jgi:hypothetical protein
MTNIGEKKFTENLLENPPNSPTFSGDFLVKGIMYLAE